jgi:AcrR family transcriptional regulator
MARKPLRKPRKNASQKRSRVTVDALIEATARILVREGFDRASTNPITEIAGVGVGSLYQHYPGKEALVAAVIDRHNEEIMWVVRAALAEVASQLVEEAVRKLVTVAIEAGPYRFVQNRPRTFLVALKSHTAAGTSKNQPSRDFWG